MPDHSFSNEIFPNIKSKPPLMQLEPIASHPITSYWGEETNTCLTTTSCQVVVESNKAPPQPFLLQTKKTTSYLCPGDYTPYELREAFLCINHLWLKPRFILPSFYLLHLFLSISLQENPDHQMLPKFYVSELQHNL